jgi:hypothetical protein
VLIRFTRRTDNGTAAEFTRPDGVRLRLHSYDRTGLVPHDAAHLVVERAFRLRHGVWGCLCDGALFDSVEIVEGRTRHDHKARSAALRKRHDADLRLAEQLVGAVLAGFEHRSAEMSRHLKAAWEIYRTGPAPDLAAAGRAALDELAVLRARWDTLPTGATFELEWPPHRKN